MRVLNNPPYASSLIESVRSLGYSFETALADLIDNAISARAHNIQILATPSQTDPSIIVIDDGDGMNSEELVQALRFGCKNPKDMRREDDLGRFGLGMKTASLSLCRKLLIASKQNGTIRCLALDLDEIEQTGDWSIIEYDDSSEIAKLSHIDLLESNNHGTYLLLQKFDRLMATSNNLQKTLNEKLVVAEDHISLVFHRIITEDGLTIAINGRSITPKDPFLSKHRGTQPLRDQIIIVDDSNIVVRPFILPHRNQLSNEDLKLVGGADDLRQNQGFYIYRCKRLILWGTWFRLLGKQELNKLARVQVDIPNTLDELWDIDVKKSSARLPDRIKDKLYSAVKDSVFRSEYVIRNTGNKNKRDDIVAIWERSQDEKGGVHYRINRQLPQLKMLEERIDDSCRMILADLLRTIETTFPAREIYLDVADGEIIEKSLDELIRDFNEMLSHASAVGMEHDQMVTLLLKTEPFCHYNNFEEEWRKRNE